MRLPYLQVNQELFEVLAPALSIELEISEGDAALMLLRLWKCLVETGTDEAPPTGLIHGAKAVVFIERSVRWSGKPGAFVVACIERLDLIERVGEGLRIRGAKRYRRTWEKNRRRKPADSPPVTGAILAGSTKPAPFAPVTGDKPARQTQTQTQTHIKGGEAPGSSVTQLVGQPTEAGGLRDALEAAFKSQRRTAYAWRSADDNACRELLALAKGDWAEISRRWGNALRRARFPLCNGLADLAKYWNAYAVEEGKAAASGDRPRL